MLIFILITIFLVILFFGILKGTLGKCFDVLKYIGLVPIVGDIIDGGILVLSLVFTIVVLSLGLKAFHFELNLCHIDKNKTEIVQQAQNQNTNNYLLNNLKTISSEEKQLLEKFDNKTKNKNDALFADFYKKLQKNAIDISTYDDADSKVFYERESLIEVLEKNNIAFEENKTEKIIKLKEYQDYVFSYNNFLSGFVINHQYFIDNYSSYLSEQWISYLLLMKEHNKDIIKAQPNDDGVDLEYCMKWQNKFEVFLSTYPDFYLNNEIQAKINGYKEALKGIGY